MQRSNYRHRVLNLLGGVVFLGFALLPMHAAASGQSFRVIGSQPTMGMLMSLGDNSSVVSPTTTKTLSTMVGVIAPNDSNFTDQTGKVNVQTDGVAGTLLSTLNGDIHSGDRVTATAVAGIGAEAKGSGWILGTAQQNFSARTPGAVQTTVTDSAGKQHTIYVGSVPVSIKISYYSSSSQAVTSTAPSWLQNLADTLAQKHVSTKALVFGFIFFLLGLVAVVTIITSSIRNTFAAISRQPLARTQIMNIEMRSLAMAGGVMLFTLLASFLLLRVL